ncbi:MAG: HAD family phosphatase [Lachnospiraceae bacterium]
MKITTIVFDIGNVLADFCWEKHFRNICDSEEQFSRLARATVLDDAWNQFDKGALSEEELLAIFIDNAPDLEELIRHMFENVGDTIETFDYTQDWIRELKDKGYRVLILSNFSEKAYRECGEKLNFVEETDGAVISYREKLIKPDREIYELLLDRYELIPEECVFLDDKQENIDGAKRAGMQGIVFVTREEAIQELNALGVK